MQVSQQELLRRVVEALDTADIDYMLTGSLASSLQGERRSTHDLDVVIAVQEQQVDTLLSTFPRPAFYAMSVLLTRPSGRVEGTEGRRGGVRAAA